MTHEYWSMIIKTLMRNMLLSLGSLLTAFRGRVLGYALKLQSAELSVPTATESIPLSNRATTPKTESKPASASSPPSTNSTSEKFTKDEQGRQNIHYTSVDEFLHDLARGKVPASAVTLEQWLIAHAYVILNNNVPRIEKKIMVDGNLYIMEFAMTGISYSEHVDNIRRRDH